MASIYKLLKFVADQIETSQVGKSNLITRMELIGGNNGSKRRILVVGLCFGFLLIGLFAEPCQAQLQEQQLRRTLVISPNVNGQGVRVLDQNSGREVINTNNQATNGQQVEVEGEPMDDRIVSGLLEWLENKKKKKKDKEQVKPQVLPIILPEPHHLKQPKIIHIHINNHIQKHKKHGDKKHEKHKHGGYEDYHGDHYDHDKHYHGKHSWPLLGHHYNWDQDYHLSMSGFGNGYGGGHGDDYAGYESKRVASRVAPIKANRSKQLS